MLAASLPGRSLREKRGRPAHRYRLRIVLDNNRIGLAAPLVYFYGARKLNGGSMHGKIRLLKPVLAAVVASVVLSAPAVVVAQRADLEWRQYGFDTKEQHFSPLKQIDASNVGKLGLAWSADLGAYTGQIEGTPLMVDGTLYLTTPWSVAMAVDARTGKVKWKWDPKISQMAFTADARGVRQRSGPALCCGPVNRGVAYSNGKVYLGTLDNRLVALDAATGKEIWTHNVASNQDDYTLTGAPRVVNGKVIMGNAGAEFGVRGFVAAYDENTGKEAWRFYIVPGDPTLPFENKAMEAAAKTWTGSYWKYGGGGTPWDGLAYDPELNLLYIGTGNGSPWPRDLRSPGGGDNLYLSSILALRADTGEYVWHFQETPRDNWDYASTQPLVLADMTINGRPRKVIMHAPKNGFFYVIDRTNGEFISGAPFAKVNWASGLDPKTGRPIETPVANYGPVTGDGATGSRVSPGSDGAHNWHAMSWNQALGLMYIPGQDTTGNFAYDPDFQHQTGRMNTGRARPAMAAAGVVSRAGAVGSSAGGQQEGAFLVAWDARTQKERWRVRFTQPGTNLVFHGANDGAFTAYAAASGKKLWSVPLAPGFSNPITYELDGRQYVTVLTGRSGPVSAPGRLYTFAIGANAKIPSMDPVTVAGDMAGAVQAVFAEFDRAGMPNAPGRQMLQQNCSSCHAATVVIRTRQSEDAWRQTVEDMSNRGAPGTPAERDAIVKYLAQHRGPT
jgi:quinohemoprotein ethanol dehydrogenase